MTEAIQDILQRIQQLPEEDRLLLDEQLAQLAEAEWQREAEEARRVAWQQCIDQAALDRAVEKVRYFPRKSSSTPTRSCDESNQGHL